MTPKKNVPPILYLDCSSGISGDMTVASLLDLGADQEGLLQMLSSLPLEGFQIRISRVFKSGIEACDFHVLLDEEHENHDHDMAYLHGEPSLHEQKHGHPHEHDHAHHEDHEHVHHEGHEHGQEHDHEHEHEHFHEHEHEHHHDHEHGHDHGHSHGHGRNLSDIQAILRAGNLTPHALELALKIFEIVARAESRVHAKPLDEVHFHEVGAVDSIVDIASAAYCLDQLGISRVVIPVLNEGRGQIRCQHGLLPIPVPAVTEIASYHHLPLHITQVEGELVTPTGAAIAAAIRTDEKLPERFRISKTGIGAGKRAYACAGILRAMLLEEIPFAAADVPAGAAAVASAGTADDVPAGAAGAARAALGHDEVFLLQANLDDCPGEALGFVMDELFAAGALDVFFQSILMKKNRPGTLLNVLCREEDISRMEHLIFLHTTTIGIRRCPFSRTVLPREIRRIRTPLGKADVKVCRTGDALRISPEYESAAKLSRESGLGFGEVYQMIARAAREAILPEE